MTFISVPDNSQLNPDLSGFGSPCKLWLRSDKINNLSDGDRIVLWPDVSGNNHDHVQLEDQSENSAPIYKTGIFNNRWPSAKFDGNQYLKSTNYLNFTNRDAVTVFTVVKNIPEDMPAGSGTINATFPIIDITYSTTNPDKQNWQLANNVFSFAIDPPDTFDSSYQAGFNLEPPASDTHIISIRKETEFIFFRDNENFETYTYPEDKDIKYTPEDDSSTLGADLLLDKYLSGDVAEVIIFDGPLTTEEFDVVQDYLEFKYFNNINDVPLYISGMEPIHNDIPLYISTINFINQPSLNLFIQGFNPWTKIETGYGLFIKPTMSPSLYISGSQSTHIINNATLVMKGIAAGVSDIFNSIDLTISGHSKILQNIPLYIKGPIPSNNNIPLYIKGPLGSIKSMNLFIRGDNPPSSNSSLPMVIYGSTLPGAFATIPLSIPSVTGQYKSLNLYIRGSGTEIDDGGGIIDDITRSANLNLFIQGGFEKSGSIPLFLMNNQIHINNQIDLYIRGSGKNPGYIPSYNDMNLFIQGGPGGTFENPVTIANIVNLFTTGGISRENSIYDILPLFLEVNDGIILSENFDLYIYGQAIPGVSNSIPLVIYKTNLSKKLPLYIHGF